jgi:hypothetical protein
MAKDMWYRPNNKKTTGSAQNRAKIAQLARCVDIDGEGLIFSSSSNLPQMVVTTNDSKFN